MDFIFDIPKLMNKNGGLLKQKSRFTVSLLSRSDEANKKGNAITFKLELLLDREDRRKQNSEVVMVHNSGSNEVVVSDGWLAITAPLPHSLLHLAAHDGEDEGGWESLVVVKNYGGRRVITTTSSGGRG
ncbi:unnamed protein product [Lactuca saligna]|uniref:Uncharacterized protein n=1 Tax=Lactuca saligna TaxID=75948 RepID=A0AA35VDY4_LACSI|nr:unnamed protein product [Lactuca saligna]